MKLDEGKILEIEALAEDLIKDVFGDGKISFPLDLTKILDHFQMSLEVGVFKDADIVGAYDKIEKKILVSRGDQFSRQAFTIAHELGHYLLHKEKKNEIFYRTNELRIESEDRVVEKEANWFASSLLMPKPIVLQIWNLFHDSRDCAKYFGVSLTAMQFRLKNLGLI